MPAEGIKNTTRLQGIDAAVKFENILSVRDGNDEDHFVYPYWFPDPEVSEEMGRLVLWSLCQAFPAVDPRELRALDVIRGQTFSLDRNPLRGDEAEVFARRFDLALHQWNALRAQYDG